MFFLKKNYYKKNYKIKNFNFILKKNLFNIHQKNILWHFFFNGFYFDDIFSKLIKKIFNQFFNISSFFILDKWLSFWTGSGILKKLIKNFNKIFYIEKINYFYFLFLLIICIPIMFFIIILFTLFFI